MAAILSRPQLVKEVYGSDIIYDQGSICWKKLAEPVSKLEQGMGK